MRVNRHVILLPPLKRTRSNGDSHQVLLMATVASILTDFDLISEHHAAHFEIDSVIHQNFV